MTPKESFNLAIIQAIFAVVVLVVLAMAIHFFISRTWHVITIYNDRLEDRTPFKTNVFRRADVVAGRVITTHEYSGSAGDSGTYSHKRLQLLNAKGEEVGVMNVEDLSDTDIKEILKLLDYKDKNSSKST